MRLAGGLKLGQINRIQIYGERCSGTNYLQKLLKKNLIDIKLTWEFGFKHFFYKGDIRNNAYGCLFIAIYRDPVNWIHSLRKHPWHASKELWGLDFSSFIRSEWKAVYDEHAGIDKCNPLYGSEIPMERDPVSGERFKNVMHMRSAKIRNWQSIANITDNFTHVLYENLYADPKAFISELCEKFNLRRRLLFYPVRSYKGIGVGIRKFKPDVYPAISEDDYRYIFSNLDVKLENEIGYKIEDYDSYLSRFHK